MFAARTIAVCLFGLSLASSAWAGDAPCAPTAIEPERAAVCVYNVGKKPGFSALKVVVNGQVQGKLASKQPWMLVNVKPGVNVIGIDLGNAPHARSKVETVAGQVTYLRYMFSFDSDAGFFDMTSARQAQLQEVSAGDALADLDRFTSPRAKRKRT